MKNITNNNTDNYSFLKTDIHSHLIPGLDDGVKSIKEAIECISRLNALGFSKIITTPHINSEYFHNTPETIRLGLEKLNAAIKKLKIPIVVEAAAEYYLNYDFIDSIVKNELLTFGDNYVLFELSYYNATNIVDEAVFKMQTHGYKPVLAHPERYNYWNNNIDIFKKLKDKGVLFQMNTLSLNGVFSVEAKNMAENFIKNNMIEFIGSDAHNINYVIGLELVVSNKYFKKLRDSGLLLNQIL